jgi:ketosteroid isomerase-like protein
MKNILATLLMLVAVSSVGLAQRQSKKSDRVNVEQEVLKAEREEREAYLRRDAKALERMVADEFVFTATNERGSKAMFLTFIRETPGDPTLTLTSEDTHVSVNGDTAVVVGRRVERRRRRDNNAEGVAYARYARTYVKRQGRWQLLSEHLQPVPRERTAVKVAPGVYSDYVGKYDSPIFAFSVFKEGDKLIAVPDERERPSAELLPESESEFFLGGRDVQVTFMRGRDGQVTHALLRLNGVDVRARRIG